MAPWDLAGQARPAPPAIHGHVLGAHAHDTCLSSCFETRRCTTGGKSVLKCVPLEAQLSDISGVHVYRLHVEHLSYRMHTHSRTSNILASSFLPEYLRCINGSIPNNATVPTPQTGGTFGENGAGYSNAPKPVTVSDHFFASFPDFLLGLRAP